MGIQLSREGDSRTGKGLASDKKLKPGQTVSGHAAANEV